MQSQEHCIADRMMGSSFAACHKRRHKKYSKKRMMGVCGAHQPGLKFGDRLRRLGYYWSKMIPDAIAYAKRCHAYQVHGDFIH